MPVMNSGRFSAYTPGQANPLPGFENSPAYDWMADLEREAYYGNFLGREGLMGFDNQSDAARALFSRLHQGYEAATFENPDYDWKTHLDRYKGRIPDLLQSIDPATRGIDPSRSTGGARWLDRRR